ncbi:EAL domain-containing protein [Shinella sp.]|uniref:EAL domain-containing protein n=1 Tax=Shinella sp. TaxID=1870904 RepID=UPI00301BF934
MKTSPSAFAVTIDNLPEIALAYSDGVAARVLYETWQRLSSTFGSETWSVCEKSWGVALHFYGSDVDKTSFCPELIEAALAAAGRRPVPVGTHRIVVGLSARFGEVAPVEPAVEVNAQQYRLDMCAAALAYDALEAGRVHFAEQPIAAADDTAKPLYCECLARLVSDDGTVLLPGTYLGAVERLGLMRAFDRHVVREVVRQLRIRPDAVLGCNVSGRSAVCDIWWSSTLEVLARNPDLAGRLVIEITETAALPDVPEAKAFVSAIRGTGARVALDDFGAGYSSASFAREARVDIVKIDGSFVRQRVDGPAGQQMLNHLVNLVSGFGATIVVEGVETAEDLRVAAETGARWFQGYYFRRPELSDPVLSQMASIFSGRLH